MADQKKRISELPLEESTDGLVTIGVNSKNESVRVPLGDLLKQVVSSAQDAVDSVMDDLEQFKTDTKEELNEDISGLQDSVSELEEAVWPITISLTATSTLLEYTGEAQTVTLTATTTRKGEQVTSEDGKGLFYKGASLEERTENLGSGSLGYMQVNVSVNTLGTTTFGFVWYKDDVVKADATIGIRMVLPMYFGFNALTTPTENMLTSLIGGMTKQTIKASAAGTYTLTNPADGNYPWFCVPLGFTISRVTLNGFDVPLEEGQAFVVTGIGSYTGYRGSNALVAGTYTFVIS